MNAMPQARPLEKGLVDYSEPAVSVPRLETASTHVGALDGVRGLAILMVLLHHLAGSVSSEFLWANPLLSLCRVGWAGVDLFFVLSGFLITGILYDAKGRPHFLKNFYARRALRIFPLYYAALLALSLLRVAWPDAGFYPVRSQAWLWVYATNFVIAAQGFDSFGIIEHFWSLAVEEHFYLVWPFVVLLCSRRRLMIVAAVTCVAALSLRIVLVAMDAGHAAPYVLTPARVDALAAGAFIALAARGGGLARLKTPAWVVGSLCLTGFAAIVLMTRSADHSQPWLVTAGTTLLAGLFASALVLCQTFPPLERILSVGALRFLGKYSYGIYVWHPLLFIIVLHTDLGRSLRGGSDLPNALLALAIAFASTALVTALSWNLIESRFLSLKKNYN